MNRTNFVAASMLMAAGMTSAYASGLMDLTGGIGSAFPGNFNVFSAVKWSSIAAAIGGAIYLIVNKKLLHLEVIEIGEMGFRTKYGKPVQRRLGRKRGQRVVYYPGDRVIVIPIVHDIVVASTRTQVDTASCQGVYRRKNIHFDIEIEWQVLADEESAYNSVFTLHDVIRDDEKNPTLGALVEQRTKCVVDAVLATLPSDNNGLPVFDKLDLYSPSTAGGNDTRPLILATLEDHGVMVNAVRSANRMFAPEERQKEGLTEAIRGLVN